MVLSGRDRPNSHSFRLVLSLTLTLVGLLINPYASKAVGLMPVPVFTGADIQVEVDADPADPFTTDTVYKYTISNPDINTGDIWYFKIDISAPSQTFDLPSDPTLPRGLIAVPFGEYLERLEPLSLPEGAGVVPIGQKVPPGWLGGFGRDGFLGFATGIGTSKILPGQTLGGFQILTRRLPTVRAVEIIPDWMLLVQDHDAVTEEELNQAAEVETNLRFKTFTLGPAGDFQIANFRHFSRLDGDINKMIEIGWIDGATGTNLLSELAEALQAFELFDGTTAKASLQTMSDVAAGLRAEARQLIQLNVQAMIERIADAPVPFHPREPVFRLTPETAELTIGTLHTVTLRVVDASQNSLPFTDFENFCGCDVIFRITEGPHALQFFGDAEFDASGEATFSYVGTSEGVDTIEVGEFIGEENDFELIETAQVRWKGGPDLAVAFFRPPVIVTEAGKTIFVTDTTTNLGNLPSPPSSVTRYFLSGVEPVDPLTATVVGERQVGALEPGEDSDGPSIAITVPSGFPPGTYFMAACADANEAVVELKEDNNCSFSQLETVISIIVPMETSNSPPDCSQASANPETLWPPNHKTVDIAINGVTDPDGDPVILSITSIQQDEPVNGLGDGDTSPDGFGVGTARASVRSERSGKGNGRIYIIGFEAEDDKGANCTGSVQVGVPHDRGKGAIPTDDRLRFDSTQP